MSVIVQAIAGAFLRELLAALTGYFQARRMSERDVALGRTQAELDAALAAARAADEMAAVGLPDIDEALKQLREGQA